MTFQSLHYFLTVYEERSITVAARKLFISQQCLSAHIQKLESVCGTELFVRRPVFKATYAGDRLAAAAQEILRLRKEILAELKEIKTGQGGKMMLGFSGVLAGEHLPNILEQFYSVYPGIEVTAVTSDSSDLEEHTVDGKIDLYIGTSASRNSVITTIPLINITLVLVVRRSVLRQFADFSEQQIEDTLSGGIALEELSSVPLILPMRGWRVRKAVDDYMKANRLNIKPILEANQSITLSACLKGIGAGILYSTTPLDDEDDQILKFPLKNIDYTIDSSICYRCDHFLTAYEEEFIHLTKAYFENYHQNI